MDSPSEPRFCVLVQIAPRLRAQYRCVRSDSRYVVWTTDSHAAALREARALNNKHEQIEFRVAPYPAGKVKRWQWTTEPEVLTQ